jgi:hypothetical protein
MPIDSMRLKSGSKQFHFDLIWSHLYTTEVNRRQGNSVGCVVAKNHVVHESSTTTVEEDKKV